MRRLALIAVFSLPACASTEDPPPASTEVGFAPDTVQIVRTSRRPMPAPATPAPSAAEASAPDTDPMTPLATFHSVRKVAMYYQLDLESDNSHAPSVSAVLQANDSDLRTCYTSRLSKAPALRGNVVFKFRLSRADGGMDQVERVSGTLTDTPLLRCLEMRLSTIPFAPARDMKGTLTYEFDSTDPVTSVGR